MRSFDVLIVGGGPAGSSCAWKLRRSGLRVAVLDRASFPRDKVCAGWITPQVVEELELDLEEYAKNYTCQPFHGFRVGALGGDDVAVDYRTPVSFGIRRCEFDTHLLRRSGAELLLGESVRSLRVAEGGWVVNDSLQASLLVGAGGHFCPVVRLVHPDPPDPIGVVAAQEVEFALEDRAAAACTVRPELPELYFMDDLRGYGWAVRKGAFLNVGLGRQDSRDLGAHVGRFLDFLQARGALPAGSPRKLRGHAYLLYGLSPRPLVGDRLLLVGDAAGLADPRSGEGIRPAIESGLLAAAVVLRSAGGYESGRAHAVSKGHGPPLRAPGRAPRLGALGPCTAGTAAPDRALGPRESLGGQARDPRPLVLAPPPRAAPCDVGPWSSLLEP